MEQNLIGGKIMSKVILWSRSEWMDNHIKRQETKLSNMTADKGWKQRHRWRMQRVIKSLKKMPVNKYTRAKHKGTEIVCSECCAKSTVYHFSWTALVCDKCNKTVNKDDWTVAFTDKDKYGYEYVRDGKKLKLKKFINTELVDVLDMFVDTSDWPDCCDSYIQEANWHDGTELTDEEYDDLNDDSSFVYEQIESHLY